MERSMMHIFDLSSVVWVLGFVHSMLKLKTTKYNFFPLSLYLLNFEVNTEKMLR